MSNRLYLRPSPELTRSQHRTGSLLSRTRKSHHRSHHHSSRLLRQPRRKQHTRPRRRQHQCTKSITRPRHSTTRRINSTSCQHTHRSTFSRPTTCQHRHTRTTNHHSCLSHGSSLLTTMLSQTATNSKHHRQRCQEKLYQPRHRSNIQPHQNLSQEIQPSGQPAIYRQLTLTIPIKPSSTTCRPNKRRKLHKHHHNKHATHTSQRYRTQQCPRLCPMHSRLCTAHTTTKRHRRRSTISNHYRQTHL